MTLIAFVMLALGFTIATFILQSGRTILAFASAGGWIVLAVYSYTRSTATWDIYYALFWLGCGLAFALVLVPAVLREKKEKDISVEDVDEYGDKELLADIEASERDKKRLDKLFGTRRARR